MVASLLYKKVNGSYIVCDLLTFQCPCAGFMPWFSSPQNKGVDVKKQSVQTWA